MYCKYCDKKIPSNSKFCRYCGAEVVSGSVKGDSLKVNNYGRITKIIEVVLWLGMFIILLNFIPGMSELEFTPLQILLNEVALLSAIGYIRQWHKIVALPLVLCGMYVLVNLAPPYSLIDVLLFSSGVVGVIVKYKQTDAERKEERKNWTTEDKLLAEEKKKGWLWLGIGAVITLGTLFLADEGETYYVFWGPMIYGAYILLKVYLKSPNKPPNNQ